MKCNVKIHKLMNFFIAPLIIAHFCNNSAVAQTIDPMQEIKKDIEKMKQENQILFDEIKALKTSVGPINGREKWYDRFTLGGYGEIHYNQNDSKTAGDKLDFHRFVLYIANKFSDHIQLHSELEIEHAFVKREDAKSTGYILFEQLYLDFELLDGLNFQAGRFLAPFGLINRTHEPTTFNGVERSYFNQVLIPTTWSLDGLNLAYQSSLIKAEMAYVAGLDGSRFSSTKGIRDGRQLGEASTNSWMALASMEVFPLEKLKIGASYAHGGVSNGYAEKLDASVKLTSVAANLQYTWNILDLQYTWGRQIIKDVQKLNNFKASTCASKTESWGEVTTPASGCKVENIAEIMSGQSVEIALHVLPDMLKQGRLQDSDLVIFARQDHVNTQAKMSEGITSNKAGDVVENTYGISFYPISNVVAKLDVQQVQTQAAAEHAKKFNLGLGWMF